MSEQNGEQRAERSDIEVLETVSWHWRPRYVQALYCSHRALMYSYAGWAVQQ